MDAQETMDVQDKNNATVNPPRVDCQQDPIGSLLTMFVTMLQEGRIARGQSAADCNRPCTQPRGPAFGSHRRPWLRQILLTYFLATMTPCSSRRCANTLERGLTALDHVAPSDTSVDVCGSGSLFDELGCFLRMRHVSHMAGIHFDRLGMGALRHHALLLRVD
jgi:hypothetical protein